MHSPAELIKAQFTEAAQVLERVMANPTLLSAIAQAGELLVQALKGGGKILTCGNGGSHCDAMHMAEELTGRFRDNRQPLAALAIADPSHISCVANDYGYEHVFSRYVQALGQPGDVLVAISTSGNSANVLRAAEAAREKGMQVLALTGKGGGALAPLAHAEVRVPHQGYADRIQEVHIKVIHILIMLIEQAMEPGPESHQSHP